MLFHRLERWLVLAAVVLAGAGAGDAAAAGATGSTGEISYVIRWQPAAGGIPRSEAIGMSLTFTAEEARTKIFFPDRWALGLRELHRRITDISVDGSLYAASLDGPTLELKTRLGQRVAVEYLLSRRRSGTAQALPEALLPTATHDHVFLPGWVGLAIPDFFRCTSIPCARRRVRLRWDVPASWRVANDHGAGAREFVVPAIDSPSMLDSLFIAGSTFRSRGLARRREAGAAGHRRASPKSWTASSTTPAHVATIVQAHWPADRGERAVWLDRLAGGSSRGASGAIQATSNMAIFRSDFERGPRRGPACFPARVSARLDRIAAPGGRSAGGSRGAFPLVLGRVSSSTSPRCFLFRFGRLSTCEMAVAYDETFQVVPAPRRSRGFRSKRWRPRDGDAIGGCRTRGDTSSRTNWRRDCTTVATGRWSSACSAS